MAVAPNGNMYVVNVNNHRIQYFTSTGSYLGVWGSYGSGNGQFNDPADVAESPSGGRVYVTDRSNNRVQYFKLQNPAVAPASLGKVKALFQ